MGTHPKSDRALGWLADARLRRARWGAHRAFDRLWKEGGYFRNRREAYTWLAGQLGIEPSDCHMGWFDAETCYEVEKLSKEKYATPRGGFLVQSCWRTGECPKSRPWAVFDGSGRVRLSGCYKTLDKAWRRVEQMKKEGGK